jgi:ribA/ribD-fused uncharacterized protein
MISDFHSQGYEFLSNFHMTPVLWEGILYPSSEHAYQASKTLDPNIRKAISLLSTPGKAKRAKNNFVQRPDWNDKLKLLTMEAILRIKFQDPKLRALLDSTKGQELIEGNTWNDTFWGVCNGKGKNHLGTILMNIRDEHDWCI